MKTSNLISVYQGAAELSKLMEPSKERKTLKPHEIRNLQSFCALMWQDGCRVPDYDGFFVGFTIAQIGKEFDLLRFGDSQIINIEIKSELKVANKEEKVLKQLRTNYYYLKAMGRPLKIFCYVEHDGFFEYDIDCNGLRKINSIEVASCIRNHKPNYNIDPSKEFVPSNYLISPFNSTEAFINGSYFLTTVQQRIKNEVYEELRSTPFMFFTLSANAGTGKTLLMYDIAKEMMQEERKIKIIHCGALNEGQCSLNRDYGWEISSIKLINSQTITDLYKSCDLLFIDEAQRIRERQLRELVQEAIRSQIPIFFSYDTKQYLRDNEGRDINKYLGDNFSNVALSFKKLTTKIRTNKEMASFISNLLNVGSSRDHLNYDNITIEYINDIGILKLYVGFLKSNGWMPLTYTTSQYDNDPYDLLAGICDKTAHNVIGQEFPKVLLVMDSNFRYDSSNRLTARNAYYSAKGMLYQIVTRVVDELKIIVTDNPELYSRLLDIKSMGE